MERQTQAVDSESNDRRRLESVEEIAAATGFANRHHFTRVFAATTGTDPGAYRKWHKQA
ncbi:MAG: helix-turn-helix domain-containing protein [Opitutaceae bacterium]